MDNLMWFGVVQPGHAACNIECKRDLQINLVMIFDGKCDIASYAMEVSELDLLVVNNGL